MRLVIQRVSKAEVIVDGQTVGKIGSGLLILLGVGTGDGVSVIRWGARKVAEMRIFEDNQRKMNRSLLDSGGEALVVSQFTLYADARKGRRPSFIGAAPPETAKILYELFINELRALGVPTASGVFAAKMSVSLTNEGPVTIILERNGDSESSLENDER